MSSGGTIGVPGTDSDGGILAFVHAIAQDVAQLFSPLNVFRLSFVIAGALCLIYAIALPVRYYEETDLILLSDLSIYYFLSAIAMFMTERALKDFDRKFKG